MNPTTPNTKVDPPGYKTTEFWLTFAVSLLTATMAFLEQIDATWAVVALSLVNSLYILARSSLKSAANKAVRVLVLLLACSALLALPGCTITIDPATGQPSVGVDPAALQTITDQAVERINQDLRRPGK